MTKHEAGIGAPEVDLHPRILAEQRQAELDLLYPDIAEEIEMWNLRFAVEGNDPQSFNKLAGEAVSSLDAKWPFYGDLFLVSGMWHFPEVSTGPNAVGWHYGEASEVMSMVKSDGFAVTKNAERACVGYSFYVGELPVRSPIARGTLDCYAFADPTQISLDYVRPQELTNRQILERTHETLEYCDSLLRLHINYDRSDFFRSSQKKQKMFIDSVLSDANDTMIMPGLPIQISVTTPYAYICNMKSTSTFTMLAPKDSRSRLIFNGQLDAVTLLEAGTVQHRAIRDRAELVDPDAGLCLVVKLQEHDLAETIGATHVFIPSRQMDQLELEEG